ncbi:hypothetical protein KI387_024613 [Taxus chinensis]|uniref:Metallo-beta-lactamase domain-containing protein n=1 Tax=Taxus chinensis TaxID=29808 RepID=A0AA38G3Z7_TAXCH|nr:hypothetical protein KI387_024613 [Taxus chinensis]
MQSSDSNKAQEAKGKNNKGLEIAGYSIEGLSIGGQETCVIVPSLRMAFDIGRCPQRAISQEFLFISHGHMDHIGGLPMYVATRGLYSMRPPTIFVPADIKEHVEKLFEVHRAMDHSELSHNLIALNVGEDYQIRKDIIVKTFKTYHVIPSQGYIIYLVKNKLKKEYLGLPGNDIKQLKFSGVKITDIIETPEIAFTGDTMSDFIVDPNNIDALRAKILIMETTFVDDAMSVEHARDYGHTHLSESMQTNFKIRQSCSFTSRHAIELISPRKIRMWANDLVVGVGLVVGCKVACRKIIDDKVKQKIDVAIQLWFVVCWSRKDDDAFADTR